jgi:hypothetical protein
LRRNLLLKSAFYKCEYAFEYEYEYLTYNLTYMLLQRAQPSAHCAARGTTAKPRVITVTKRASTVQGRVTLRKRAAVNHRQRKLR